MDATEPLRRAARCWGDGEALRDSARTITFAALDERVNRLARELGRAGVVPGDRVATFLPNGIQHVVAELGVLRAGAVWVAINQRLAPPEVDYMLEHSGARVLVGDGDVPLIASRRVDAVFDLSGRDAALERRLADAPPNAPDIRIDEGDDARLRYTSGTTGRPKGAVLTHRSALTSLRSLLGELHELGPDDVIAHAAPLTHASAALLAPAFWRGARTIICESFDPAELRTRIVSERVTALFLVPTMIRALLDEPSSAPEHFATVKTLVYGAAPMPEDLMVRALELFGPVLLQIYGLSECPFPITSLRKADHLDPGRRRSCGLPTPSNDLRIVDEEDRPLAPGAIGTIAVRGPQMMRGYWQDAEATAAVLRDGWLRTGDVGSVDDAGFLTLIDRTDDVIITGGFNVYPREVELVLESHPEVVEAAVAAVPHPRWGQGVGAWVVSRRPGSIAADELIDFCRAHLAGYKKPVRIAFVPALPKSPTGKLLRRELRQVP